MVKCDDFKWPGCSYETPSDTLELEGSLLEGLVRFQQAADRCLVLQCFQLAFQSFDIFLDIKKVK